MDFLRFNFSNNTLTVEVEVASPILFDLDFQLEIRDQNDMATSFHIRQQGWDVSWLPKGTYCLRVNLNESGIDPQIFRFRMIGMDNANNAARVLCECNGEFEIESVRDVLNPGIFWQLDSTSLDISKFSWKKGYEDWFYRHFDHASRVIKDLMFANSDRLKGKVLDVGCGDGVTDCLLATWENRAAQGTLTSLTRATGARRSVVNESACA